MPLLTPVDALSASEEEGPKTKPEKPEKAAKSKAKAAPKKVAKVKAKSKATAKAKVKAKAKSAGGKKLDEPKVADSVVGTEPGEREVAESETEEVAGKKAGED